MLDNCSQSLFFKGFLLRYFRSTRKRDFNIIIIKTINGEVARTSILLDLSLKSVRRERRRKLSEAANDQGLF